MSKKYREIEFGCGTSLESAVKELKSHEDLVCGSFNGQMLYSDIDDMDSAYKKVQGMTKKEFDDAKRKSNERYKLEKITHYKAIPELTKEWIKKGKAVLDSKHFDYWEEIVPIRLADLYRGMELGSCLSIVEALNKGVELEKAKEIIEGQGHSGMSFGLVCSMVKHFCDRGDEFVNYVR